MPGKRATPGAAPAEPARLTPPAIALPKGGGAVRGIGEKFAANPVTGMGSTSVPIATSPGRSGFGPQLSLSYDSGAGNGPFGFGWSLSLPSITRKTDKGLPEYFDAQESDVFILSGAEDLVPVYRRDPDGTWTAGRPGFQRDTDGLWVRDPSGRMVVHEDELDGYRIRRYRPRIEGLFARIECWTKLGAPGDVHWRSISKDNILTLYGLDANSRITDPRDAGRIFSWLICETRDDKGNAVLYRYKPEDGVGVHLDTAHERNRGPRNDIRRTANRYLKRIHYGNRTPLLDAAGHRPRFLDRSQIDTQIASANWMFEVVFDYGDHDPAVPKPTDDQATDAMGGRKYPWRARPDPFSTYRPGFEVRTSRVCQRVLIFHHFPGESGVERDCLVRSTDLTYSHEVDPANVDNPVYSFLLAVTQAGYSRTSGGYVKRSMPPVEFEYSKPIVQEAVEEIDPESLENLPTGLDGASYRWIDLHGEGIGGILTEQAGAWFYKRNLSPIPEELGGGLEQVQAHFAPLELVALKPNVALSGGANLMDLAGDGRPDVVIMDGPTPGVYQHDEAEGWQPFHAFASRLNRDLRDPNLKFVDLDGDGHADVLITEDDAITWHPSLAEEGFGPVRRVVQALDEDKGPRVAFADGTDSIYVADLSGDGLSDIVRIRNGEVCYWPNLGFGRFGAKITMDNAPVFDAPDQFDQQRIRIADIDGSGTIDIVYLHRDGVRLYFNQAGNSWSRPHRLTAFPRVDDVVSIDLTDLLGNGTACLVWSSPLPGDRRRQMRYVNLMGGRKPHLLVRTINNLGAETRVTYAPSTKFYLQDKRAGKSWITRVPFPAHVVERVEILDHISRNRFVTRYAYHHGYFDAEEREFRGFGMVEQWDTEEIAALGRDGTLTTPTNLETSSHVPPVHIKSWFHTGVYIGSDHVSDYFAGLLNRTDPGEYFREPGRTDSEARDLLLPDTVIPAGLARREEREACRALKGMMLRQEVYADDAGPAATAAEIQRAHTPYTVTEQTFGIRALQPCGSNRHAVFFTHPREAIVCHYERDPVDPRIQHALTLEVDDYGNVMKQAAIGYGRRETIRVVDAKGEVHELANPELGELHADDRAKQTTALLSYTENGVTNPVESLDTHRAPLPCEAVTFELTGYTSGGAAGRYEAADLVEADPSNHGRLRHRFTTEVAYEDSAIGNSCRRPIEWQRTLYRRDDLTGLLPLGEVESRGLPGESYKLAFTPGSLVRVYQRPRAAQPAEALLPDPAAVLGGQAGNRGGYVPSQALKADGRFPATDADDYWWIPSGRSFFATNQAANATIELNQALQHFFVPRRYRNPFGEDAFVDFDADDLLMVETRDALGNRVTVNANDYRVLQPRLVSDPNRNRTGVVFDTLGMVAGTAMMGKALPAPAEGDTLDDFVADLTQVDLDTFFDGADPHVSAASLLRHATTRTVYDLHRFSRTRHAHPGDSSQWHPACAATLARETHADAPLPPQGLRIHLTFSYSDGFGREIQTKLQSEPGPVVEGGAVVGPRWVASGWSIFNNKGKPVCQYEPFFSATHRFEFGVTVGVSSVLFYDPAERLIATLQPNRTYEKVLFHPWQQTTYDVSDTCAPRNQQTGDPRTDHDIQGYVSDYFGTQPASWQTWHAQRIAGALGPHEQEAAAGAAAHADTPATTHLDALARPFLTVARNRVVCAGHDLDGTEESFITRVELDIEGNQREVHDERRLPVDHRPTGAPEQRIVMRYAYDMLGNRIYQISMDAGARWMLNDVAGKPIRTWDSRGHNFITTYDPLRRAVEQTVRGTTTESDPRTLNRDILIDKIEYGEPPPNAQPPEAERALRFNLRTRIYRHMDSAGIATNARLDANGDPVEAYDFKGNLLGSTRRLVSDYAAVPDWRLDPKLNDETFESSTRYDAFDRPVQSIAPHSSLARATRNIIQPVFNDANLLKRVDVWAEWVDPGPGHLSEPDGLLNPANQPPSPIGVANVDYDAKGQRLRIDYKNGASTVYGYDPLTFQLTHLFTRRGPAFTEDCDNPKPPPAFSAAPQAPPERSACGVQNLCYTYDPVGNITHVHDTAQQVVYFRNQRIEPSNDYNYDALYRLIQATGREHLGQQANGDRHPPTAPKSFNTFHIRQDHPNVSNAMGRYSERYVYDAVGNFMQTQHRGSDPPHAGWRLSSDHLAPSLIENAQAGVPQKTNNRVTGTSLSPGAGPPEAESYQHDPHGNMVRMPHLGGSLPGPNMRWDHKDQLQRVDLGGGGAAFSIYDSSGQRIRKVWEKAPGRVEERIYLGGFEIFRKHGGAIGANTATLERETLHVMDSEHRIALVEMCTLDTAGNDPAPPRLVRYQFGNHLGSAILELDEHAQIISYEEYAPYGSTTYQAVRSQTETPKRYRYTGKERDEESGLYYHGARYYSPGHGVWTSADPAGVEAGINLYAYARNNPIGYRDSDGRSPLDFAAGKAWEKEIMSKLKQSVLLVEQVTVTAKIGNKTVTSVLDGLAKTGEGWAIIESKLSDPTLRKAQEQIREHLLKGGSVTVAASTAEKLADLQKTLGISSKTLIATKTYDVVTQGTAAQILTKYKAIPEGFGTILHATGEIEYLSADQRKLFEEVMRDNPGKTSKHLMTEVRRLEQEAAEKATTKLVQQGEGLLSKGGKEVAEGAEKLVKEEAAAAAKNASLVVKEGATVDSLVRATTEGAKVGKEAAEVATHSFGKKLLKVVPFVGMGVGVASMTYEWNEGNYFSATLDAVGLIPGIGDALDLARLVLEPGPAY